MAFDWAKYLTLAEELGMHSDNEAALRSAVSRAYYAAFCKARNRLRQEGVQVPKAGVAHTAVWNKYREAAEQRRRSIGTTGDRLRRNRNKADYDDEFPFIPPEWEADFDLQLIYQSQVMAEHAFGTLYLTNWHQLQEEKPEEPANAVHEALGSYVVKGQPLAQEDLREALSRHDDLMVLLEEQFERERSPLLLNVRREGVDS